MPPPRQVFLRDMILAASIGVHAHEHAAPQRVRINVDMAVTDTQPTSDDLSQVVDYEAVARTIRAIVTAGHIRLVETLAERLAAACLQDSRIQSVRIRVEKLDIFTDTAAVGVEIQRWSPGHSPI